MNIEIFNKLMELPPCQEFGEWLAFLEICDTYLKKHDIKKPIVVELGILHGHQKRFYEQLFGAEHIGIDYDSRRCVPDICGTTHSPDTLETLKKKLKGRPINILYIDADHHYEAAKKDFEIYSPLCSDIIALNDIETGRHSRRKRHLEVWKFWDELKESAYTETGKYEKYLFISIRKARFKKNRETRVGTGIIIKK